MRTLFDTEEEEIEGKASEITLSTASLLGIFFGLVLICGVFFGFGYSTGRGTGAGAQASLPASNANNAGEADETAAGEKAPPPPPAPTPAPAPAQADAEDDSQANVKTPAPVATHAKADETPAGGETPAPTKTMSETPAQLVAGKPTAGRQNPAYLPPADAPPSATGQAMVQIAAVARPQDADVLVAALRQRGYGVVVRSEPQDNLLHVQVGPFANRMQATAIKQKLLSDGYNAIIKQ
jgi:DedD protein